MDELLTITDVAKILKVNPSKVYQLIDKGYLRAMKLGCLKVRRRTVEEFLEKYDGTDFGKGEIK